MFNHDFKIKMYYKNKYYSTIFNVYVPAIHFYFTTVKV